MASSGKKRGKIGYVIVLLALLGVAGYFYTSPEFEQEAPQIHIDNVVFWNRKEPLRIKISDNRGLKSYQFILSDGSNSEIVDQQLFENQEKEKEIFLKYPRKSTLNSKARKLKLQITVNDNSQWNFLSGNESQKVVTIEVDYKRPSITILANSYSITQGGSALVVFEAKDRNLAEVYIKSGKKHFKVQPYKEDGFYAGLIAWEFNKKEFSAKIVAKDDAGNQRVTDIPFYVKNRRYKVSWIRARDKFIDGKITDLAENSDEYHNIDDRFERLKAINETMRLKNEELIHSLSEHVSSETLDSWKMKRFYPLRNAKKVASYGDERHYYYKKKNHEISHSYHVGYDLASTQRASIKSSNTGVVVYADANGIYGNMPMIDHGLGLYTLYGHCSSLLVDVGDEVKAGQVIAKTGKSGLALGDHLHFGILVQGIEVRPIEWFDAGWIRKNIDNIFKRADTMIKSED